jgi:RNA polymerase sigma factor (sigma-70 family)
MGDERLAQLVGTGDERAFAELYRRYHQMLYRYCRGLVNADADAQDALQSTFTAALVALRKSQRDAPLRPWLFRIAHNESISLLRRRRPLQELEEDHGVAEPPAAEAAEQRAELALLVADLQQLPDRQRGALVMRELSGLSHEEIAAALGISTGAAKQSVFEARRSLQEFTEGRAMACEHVQRLISDGDRRALRGRRVRAHTRACPSCRAFAAAIPARSKDLMALAPALPAPVALGLFARLTGHAHAHAHGGAGGGLAAGATGKGVGAAISAKLIGTGAAVIATVALGAGVVHHFATPSHGTAPAADSVAHHRHPAGRGSRPVPPSGRVTTSVHANTRKGIRPASAAARHGNRGSMAEHHQRRGAAGTTTGGTGASRGAAASASGAAHSNSAAAHANASLRRHGAVTPGTQRVGMGSGKPRPIHRHETGLSPSSQGATGTGRHSGASKRGSGTATGTGFSTTPTTAQTTTTPTTTITTGSTPAVRGSATSRIDNIRAGT